MSRSKLRSKYMQSIYDGHSFVVKRFNLPVHNPHRQDEMPKNRPSKLIRRLVDWDMVRWLQEPGSFGGHKPHKNGHRMVSGIIRAKLKTEYQQEINETL